MTKIRLTRGDITKEKVDVIVNAANSSLLGGGGVDGAIHKAGGPKLLKACEDLVLSIGQVPAGGAVITRAGDLPATYVVHAVGPIWHGGEQKEAEQLRNCYLRALELATLKGARTIAFPNISTGVYRYPKEAAALVAIKAVQDGLQAPTTLDEVVFVCHDPENFELYHRILNNAQ